MSNEELGKLITKYRKAAGLTQEELADRINISRSHLGNIEIGVAGPSYDVLLLLAKELGFSIDALLYDDPALTRADHDIMEQLLRRNSPEDRKLILQTIDLWSKNLAGRDKPLDVQHKDKSTT